MQGLRAGRGGTKGFRILSLSNMAVKETKTRPKSVSVTQLKFKPTKNWLEIWNGIEQMREAKNAAVDTMGCGIPIKPDIPKHIQDYHTLISLMLSS